MFVTLRCPNCGATLEIEENREICFCTYCGVKILNANYHRIDVTGNVHVTGSVEVAGIASMRNLLARANQFFRNSDFKKAREYCNRILDIDIHNEHALDLLDRIDECRAEYGLIVEMLESGWGWYNRVWCLVDDKYRDIIKKGESKGLMLDVGQHHILFSPNKQFEISNAITHAAFYIPDEFTTIRIKVKYDSLGKYDYVISEDYVELV